MNTNNFFSIFKGEFYELCRCMILGEAHVCGECEPAQCQQLKDQACVEGHIRMINDHIKNNCVRTYRRLEKEFLGQPLECEKERWQWYNRFLFTNFLGITMPQSGTAPDEKFYSKACQKRFLNIVMNFKPRCLFVLGDRVFSHLPGDESDLWTKQPIKLDNGDSFDIWTLHHGGNVVQTLKLLHPASRMSEKNFERMYYRIRYLMEKNL
jgi:hypothetical protein